MNPLCEWLLLHYKIPPEPSAPRVYVWRKLKRMGAILYQDAAWVLPCNPRTKEQFQWLAAEIIEMGGEATLWEAQPALSGPADNLVRPFVEQADQAYAEIWDGLQEEQPDLEALSRQYQQVKSRDFFQSALGKRVRERLLAQRGGLL